jgi:competence protein ComEA
MLKKILALLVMLYATLAMAAVEVNKATDAQLDSVKGIGPSTSKLILDERKKGEFKTWQDLIERVKGIGETKAAKLSDEGLTVNGQSYKPAAAKKDEKAQKKDTKATAKEEKKADAGKPAASAAKPVASAAKPAASAKK